MADRMTTPKPKIIELSMDEWEAILERAQAEPLNEAECERLKALGESYIYLLKLLEDKRITIERDSAASDRATGPTRRRFAAGADHADPGARPQRR